MRTYLRTSTQTQSCINCSMMFNSYMVHHVSKLFCIPFARCKTVYLLCVVWFGMMRGYRWACVTTCLQGHQHGIRVPHCNAGALHAASQLDGRAAQFQEFVTATSTTAGRWFYHWFFDVGHWACVEASSWLAGIFAYIRDGWFTSQNARRNSETRTWKVLTTT